MSRGGVAIVALILLLSGSNAFWMFAVFDQAVTITYTEDSLAFVQSNYRQLMALADGDLIGMHSADVIQLVKIDVAGLKPFYKDGCLYFDQVCLRLDDNGVVKGYGEYAQ